MSSNLIPDNLDTVDPRDLFLDRHKPTDPTPHQKLAMAFFTLLASDLRQDVSSEDYLSDWRCATTPNASFTFFAQILNLDPEYLQKKFRKMTPEHYKELLASGQVGTQFRIKRAGSRVRPSADRGYH